MERNPLKPAEMETNSGTGKWKSAEFRKEVVKALMDAYIKYQDPSPQERFTASSILKSTEKYEELLNVTAKNEAEYIAMVRQKLKLASKRFLSNASDSGKDANNEWQEQTYQKIQKLKRNYLRTLGIIYQDNSKKLKEHESSQESKTNDWEYKNMTKKRLECIFSLLRVGKSDITAAVKERVDMAERYIHHLLTTVSSYQGGHSADVQSNQQFDQLNSRISQKNNMCFREHPVPIQFINSKKGINQLSTIKGPGDTAQQQTPLAQATDAFGVSIKTQGISASPLIEDYNILNEISHEPVLVSKESSATMQCLTEALSSMSSPEASNSSIGEIGDVICMSDAMPMLKSIEEPPQLEQEQTQSSLIPEFPEALSTSIGDIGEATFMSNEIPMSELIEELLQMEQQLTPPSIFSEGWKMPPSVNATSFDTFGISASPLDGFNQSTDAEETYLNSVTSKVKHTRVEENHFLLEEIKAINNLLIDSEVVIGEKDNIKSESGVAIEHNEGLVVKFQFNAVTIDQNLVFQFTADKKSLIKPLWLFVPTSYPSSSPVILDKLPVETSEDLRDLSVRAKAKLRCNLQGLDQPWSLKVIARSWERCAREAIIDYAKTQGGGTFSSKYGGWEACRF